MARITKRLLTVALLISALFSGQVGVSAQEATTLDTGRSVSARSVERRFAIYYWLDRVDIDEHYLDNEWQIAQIRKYLLISPKIDSITISSYASPEGVYERNVWLARKRAEAARRFIVNNIPEGSSLNGTRSSSGRRMRTGTDSEPKSRPTTSFRTRTASSASSIPTWAMTPRNGVSSIWTTATLGII